MFDFLPFGSSNQFFFVQERSLSEKFITLNKIFGRNPKCDRDWIKVQRKKGNKSQKRKEKSKEKWEIEVQIEKEKVKATWKKSNS